MGVMTDSVSSLKRWGREIIKSVQRRRRRKRSLHLTTVARRSFQVLWSRGESSSREICYFSSFDPDSIVSDCVIRAIRSWVDEGIDVVFVTTSPSVHDDDLAKLTSLCHAVITRANLGYDFFSWRIGFQVVPPAQTCDTVYLFNDSVYGPLQRWSETLTTVRNSTADLIGITDSWLHGYHIQSYFLAFKHRALEGFLESWINAIRVISNKTELILEYEIGLTRSALRTRLKTQVLVGFREMSRLWEQSNPSLVVSERHRLDPTRQYWRECLLEGGSPYLKVGLLRENDEGLVRAGDLESVWKNAGLDYPLDLILEHQKRISMGYIP